MASQLSDASPPVSVVLVGCGLPDKSMGWVHLVQLLSNPLARVTAVVEPWFLGAGREQAGAFLEFQATTAAAQPQIVWTSSIEDVPTPDGQCLAFVSLRTKDAPAAFQQLLQRGVSHIYLEKPGAESREELQQMCKAAQQKGVTVFLGYNKSVSAYTMAAAAVAAATDGEVDLTLTHNNAYTPDQLAECFRRNAEGMVRNMLCHELAIAVTHFGLSCDKVQRVEVHEADTELLQAGGHTDFSRLHVTLHTQDMRISFRADRCGGDWSRAQVNLPDGGSEAFQLPPKGTEEELEERCRQQPELMRYFVVQWEDYRILKQSILQHIAGGGLQLPAGVTPLSDGLEVLALADWLSKSMHHKLTKGKITQLIG